MASSNLRTPARAKLGFAVMQWRSVTSGRLCRPSLLKVLYGDAFTVLIAGLPVDSDGVLVCGDRFPDRGQPDDPTWLAYTVYGDSRASLRRY